MNLKDFLSNRDKPPELYWSLVLEDGWIQAGVWYIASGSAEIVGTSPATPWEVEDELTGAADTALSSAVQKLPEDYPEPSKTVFGVPSSWVVAGDIKPEKIHIIKKLCGDLSLNPVGFVVLPEAIAHLYKSEEGVPVNAIILGLGKESLEISVFKMGNLVGSTDVARSVSLTDDVTEGLTRFESASPLPSRFILFNGKGGELEEAKESLMQYTWEDAGKVKFLHTPKAEILSSERKVFATSLAGGNELGEVSKVSSQEESLEDRVVDADLPPETVNIEKPEHEVTPEDLGFSVEEDVSIGQENKIVDEFKNQAPEVQIKHDPPSTPAPVSIPHKRINFGVYTQKAKHAFQSFTKKMQFAMKINGPRTKKPSVGVAIIAVVLLVAAVSWWWFYPTAEVTIYVTPKSFQEDANIAFSTTGQFDMATGTIPAELVTAKVEGEKTKAATGTKLVGDRAKGTIQVQNGTAFPINLISGTTIVSSGNLKFTLDSAASVSAALSPTSPGTATLSVTSDSIGAEYNLAKGEIFKVGNYPKAEVDASSTTDFAGGSSRQISAVSKDDIQTLETQLTEELTEKAKEELSAKVSDDKLLVGGLVSTNIEDQTFDHKSGEEAQNLKLNLTVSVNTVAADRARLLEYARGVLADKVPSGFALSDDQIKFSFEFIEEKDGLVNYKVSINANFLPQTDTEEIISRIAGKSKKVAVEYLSLTPGYVRATANVRPSLPGFLGSLPRVKKHITVVTSADK